MNVMTSLIFGIAFGWMCGMYNPLVLNVKRVNEKIKKLTDIESRVSSLEEYDEMFMKTTNKIIRNVNKNGNKLDKIRVNKSVIINIKENK